MLNYTNVLYSNIFLTLGIKFGNKFTYIFVFPNFLLTLNTTLAIKERKILRRLKTQFEGKQLSLTMSFTKPCQKTLETMNVSNLSVNFNIALASYVTKQLKCRGGSLSDPLKLDHKITKYYLAKYYFS